jgi:hypothetical protein
MRFLLSPFFRFRPAAPGTEFGSKFDANKNPSCTIPVASAAGKSNTASNPFFSEGKPKYSHRTPRFSVRSDVIFQSSAMNAFRSFIR